MQGVATEGKISQTYCLSCPPSPPPKKILAPFLMGTSLTLLLECRECTSACPNKPGKRKMQHEQTPSDGGCQNESGCCRARTWPRAAQRGRREPAPLLPRPPATCWGDKHGAWPAAGAGAAPRSRLGTARCSQERGRGLWLSQTCRPASPTSRGHRKSLGSVPAPPHCAASGRSMNESRRLAVTPSSQQRPRHQNIYVANEFRMGPNPLPGSLTQKGHSAFAPRKPLAGG